ncbi:hypothetical protein TR2A62_2985 [Thalassobium sp. R2A62]|nr:hypothetical protein TR2A62_2985 [Thalassobium sp. R2A62]
MGPSNGCDPVQSDPALSSDGHNLRKRAFEGLGHSKWIKKSEFA